MVSITSSGLRDRKARFPAADPNDLVRHCLCYPFFLYSIAASSRKTLSERRRCIFTFLTDRLRPSTDQPVRHARPPPENKKHRSPAVCRSGCVSSSDGIPAQSVHLPFGGIGGLPQAQTLCSRPAAMPVLPSRSSCPPKACGSLRKALWRNYPNAASKRSSVLIRRVAIVPPPMTCTDFPSSETNIGKISSVFLLFYRSNFVLLLKLFPDALHRIVFGLLFWSADHQRQNAPPFLLHSVSRQIRLPCPDSLVTRQRMFHRRIIAGFNSSENGPLHRNQVTGGNSQCKTALHHICKRQYPRIKTVQ